MVKKSKSKKSTSQHEKTAQYRTAAMLIIGLFLLYIIYQNLLTIILAFSITSILIIIAIIVGLYFILPLLGIEGIAAVLTLIGLRKK